MLSNKPIEKIVFLSVKTVSAYPTYDDMPVNLKFLFEKKHHAEILKIADETYYTANIPTSKGLDTAYKEVYQDKAPLSPEFGKVVCISVGRLEAGKMKILTLSGANEDVLFTEFFEKAKFLSTQPLGVDICGHGIKGFHWPFLAKRIIINGLNLPPVFDLSGLKPWELTYLIDTLECWKMTSWNDYVSLDLLAATFNIPRTAEQIQGKDVNDVFHKEKDLAKIEKYCADDVFTLANVYVKMKNLKIEITK